MAYLDYLLIDVIVKLGPGLDSFVNPPGRHQDYVFFWAGTDLTGGLGKKKGIGEFSSLPPGNFLKICLQNRVLIFD